MVKEAAEEARVSDEFEPMTSTDAIRMWELEHMSLPERTTETRGITWQRALDRLHHSDVSEAKRWGMCDENANMCRDIVSGRIEALEAELAGWKRVAVEAAIPLEVIVCSGQTDRFSPSLAEGCQHAIAVIRRAVSGEGLPPAPALTDTKPKGSETP